MNAIIMAAGMSSRFAPLSYEKPKGLLKVKGEVLIERQIRQLQAAGIMDITVVVGYMKELFFYLEAKFGVRIVVNEDYFKWNNTSSLIRVLDRIDDTYICSSDNYFTENVFLDKPESAYYAAVYSDGPTDEWCLEFSDDDVITGVTIGGSDSWFMSGHVYFSSGFSAVFKPLLIAEYEDRVTKENLWEHLYMRHLDILKLKVRRYGPGIVNEFDSLDDLRAFDDVYRTDSGSVIMKRICEVLKCGESDICDIHSIKQGLTNTSFYFSVVKDGDVSKYVYRNPGAGTEDYIDRTSEVFSMGVAKALGLDDTFIYMSPLGWKISRYIEDARTLDYHNESEVSQALALVKKLHGAGIRSAFDFHIWDKSREFVDRIGGLGRRDFADFDELYARMEKLYLFTKRDGVEECLCHCDCYDPNFLIGKDGKMYLIDWEYSGNDDPASDLGTFICCSDYTFGQCEDIIRLYLGHEPSDMELRHHYAYVALAGYYWYVWAIYQHSVGNDVGDYLRIWYEWARTAGEKALGMYE